MIRRHFLSTIGLTGLSGCLRLRGRETDSSANPAQSTNVVENFEGPNNDISGYGGDTDVFSVQRATAANGSNALQAVNTPSREIGVTSGLDSYPRPGDTFRCYLRSADTATLRVFGFCWAVATEDDPLGGDAYFLRIQPGTIDLRKRPGKSTIASTSYSISSATWYDVEIAWKTDGQMDVSVFESGRQVARFSGSDSEYTHAGIGFVNNGESVDHIAYYDFYRIL